MNAGTLILRTLRYHWRSLGAVLAGIVIAGTTLTGALLMGDSVRGTLRNRALDRLAGATCALAPVDGTFTLELGRRLARTDPRNPGAPLLVLQGTATHSDQEAHANQIQVIGIDAQTPLVHGADTLTVPKGEVLLNSGLARQLAAKPGAEILLRIPKPSLLPGDAAVSTRSDEAIVLRLQVAKAAPPVWAANLSLNSRGPEPFNAFVDLTDLAESAGLEGRANIVLAPISLEPLETALRRHWTLADAELSLVHKPGFEELRSGRVFLPSRPVEVMGQATTNAAPILTYLANLIIHQESATPYSMVTAAGPPYTPPDLATNEIVVTRWLADDLKLQAGSEVDLVYYLPETGANLAQATNRFRVHSIAPGDAIHSDPSLMPDFPGLENAESTRDWETGFPLEYEIRPADEQFWKEHRGTPKAFVSLKTGRRLWANRFGDATAVRVMPPPSDPAHFASKVLARLNPADFGLQFQPVRARALSGVEQSQDFGELFLGFSLFLVIAALLLVSVLLRFNLEQRTQETGILLALGFQARTLRRWRFLEAAALTLLGTIAGVACAHLYAEALLKAMSTIWKDATGGLTLEFHSSLSTLGISLFANVAVCLAVMSLSLRREARRPAIELLSGPALPPTPTRPGPHRFLAVLSLLGALALAAWGLIQRDPNPGIFFGAGALTLLAGVGATSTWLARSARRSLAAAPSLATLSLGASARRPGRSLAVVVLLALGTFVLVSLGAFRLDAGRNAELRTSGTGGFALIAETVSPVFKDLNSADGRQLYGLESLPPFQVVPFRVRQGDQADCLNLARSFNPTLLGVRPELLEGRFSFAGPARGWDLLNSSPESGAPAIGDANSIKWSMGKQIGDQLRYPGGARPADIRIAGAVANSILQGQLVLSETAFVNLFPSESGYRFFLIETRPAHRDIVARGLSRAFRDHGIQVTAAVDRLGAFNAVQNTYLGTFQALGGIGLLLGSVGLGILVLRNVLERRAELAMLQATGFTRSQIRGMILLEHGALLAVGLGLGVAASALAAGPAWASRGTPLPWGWLAAIVLGVCVNGMLWTWVSARAALHGDLLEALRNE